MPHLESLYPSGVNASFPVAEDETPPLPLPPHPISAILTCLVPVREQLNTQVRASQLSFVSGRDVSKLSWDTPSARALS